MKQATRRRAAAPREAAVPKRPDPATSGRVSSLDGIRGVALIAVLVYHARATALPGGFLGVEMFFVLSGFLLTSLLLDEHRRTGAIDRLAYARRRLKRIAPGLVVMLTALAVLGFFIAPEDAHRLGRDIVTSLAGLTNWHLIADGSSYFAQTGRPPLVRHLWSIAVEVQAYVLIPFIVTWIARRSRDVALQILGAGILLSAVLMAILARTSSEMRAYFGTDTRIGAILAGAFVAVLLTERTSSRVRLSERAITLMGAGGSLALVALFFLTNDRSGFLYPAGFVIAQASTASLLVSSTRTGLSSETLSSSPLRWLGIRSYGIYLWHWPIVALIRPGVDVDWTPLLSAVVGMVSALGLGALSYRYVERPFFNDRAIAWPKGHVRAGGLAWAAMMTALIMLLGQSAPVDPIAESLAAGERALAAQEQEMQSASEERPDGYGDDPPPGYGDDPRPPGFGNDPVPAREVRAGRPVAAARPFRTKAGPRKNTVKVTAMGDSVMLGAAPNLKERFGRNSYINAEKNRQWRQGVEAVKIFKKQGSLGRVLIVHLGNNGPGKPSDIDAIMKEVKGICRHVVFTTVRVTKPWQDTVNENIKAAAKKYPKTVVLANWYRMSEGHRDWFYSDGTHLTRAGAEQYTKLVAGSVPQEPKLKPKATPKPTPEPTPTPLLGPLKPR